MILLPHRSTLFPYTTLFRSHWGHRCGKVAKARGNGCGTNPTYGHAHRRRGWRPFQKVVRPPEMSKVAAVRSEEHTSELQSHVNLVCRLLLEKKKKKTL